MAAAILASSCGSRTESNPFIEGWDTEYDIPPFGIFENAHYLPAIEAGIAQQTEEIQAIIDNQEEPTFDNVIAAIDRSGEILNRVCAVAFALSESDGTEELLDIVDKALPLTTEHSNNIWMNAALFAKVDAVKKNAKDLTREQEMVLDKIYNNFVKNGIALSPENQEKMKAINVELASAQNNFGKNLLKENALFKEECGFPISQYVSKMSTTEDRSLREKYFKTYSNRGNNGNEYDNKAIALRVIELSIQKAALLGYDCPANYILADKMAGNAETVDRFLAEIMAPANAKAKEEIADMQKVMDEDIAAGKLPAGSRIESWDLFYYAERLRVARYNLTEEETKPYFKMENVRNGVFTLAHNLFGINVEPLKDVVLYNEEAEAFKVTDADGSLVGVFISDYFPRDIKRGGAWMTNYVEQQIKIDGTEVRPVIVNVGSFSAPDENGVSLLSLDNVETLFHEFGHALHGLLTQCHYSTVSGTAVARDFVELPSQILENWAFLPEVLATYAFHYETGEVIPDELVAKINAADKFFQGFMTTELCAASILDLKWHKLTSAEGIDVEEFEAKACKEMGLTEEIIPRYRSTYFNHIFSGGYSAGYYSYLWAEVLDKTAFEFIQSSSDPAAAAMSFRKNILEKGGSDKPMTLFRNLTGGEPDPSALLRGRGL